MATVKRIIILWHNGGQLANQLWLYMSVLAYALERDYELENYSFFVYAEQFKLQATKNKFINIFFYKAYHLFYPLGRILNQLRPRLYKRLFEELYKKFIFFCRPLFFGKFLSTEKSARPIYLSPSPNADKQLSVFENSQIKRLYLKGWLFRNPIGLIKHRRRIIDFFQPLTIYEEKANKFINKLQSQYKDIIGVHFRQSDYVSDFESGKLYFNESEISSFLYDLLNFFKLDIKKTVFLICSDGPVETSNFSGLNTVVSNNTAIVDLLLLSKSSKIIGSDSSYGAWASYYGDRPMIVFQKEGIDWEYYRDKKKFFANKYLTKVHF